jgi:hypothetical protein
MIAFMPFGVSPTLARWFGAAIDIAERARLNLTENRTLGHEGRLSGRQRKSEWAPLYVGFVEGFLMRAVAQD